MGRLRSAAESLDTSQEAEDVLQELDGLDRALAVLDTRAYPEQAAQAAALASEINILTGLAGERAAELRRAETFAVITAMADPAEQAAALEQFAADHPDSPEAAEARALLKRMQEAVERGKTPKGINREQIRKALDRHAPELKEHLAEMTRRKR